MLGLKTLACRKSCLSIEDDRENIRLLLNNTSPQKILVPVYGSIELFTSRIPPTAMGKEQILRDDSGEKIYLKQHEGVTITCAEKPYSLLGNLHELREMGYRNFILDLRDTGLETPAGQRVMGAFFDDEVLSDSVNLNFKRGLS